MKPDLSVNLGGVRFATPVTVASGTFAHAEKYYHLEEVRRLGAIVPKTVTFQARQGNPPPRIVETPAGMLNAIGIENPGLEGFVAEKLPALQKIGVPLILSVLGHSDREFLRLVEGLQDQKNVVAIELNLSCPNLGKPVLVAQDPRATHRLIRKVKKISAVPILAKLSPNVTDITVIARAAEEAGADGLSLINTASAMVIDVEKRCSVLGNVTGGLSGPAIRPMAVYYVYQTARAVSIPLVAMGGIFSARDALEFLIAGATLVAVGTANFINPRAPLDILEGITDYLKRHRMKTVRELIGSFREEQ